jgi:hypothetical protein
MNHGHCTHSGRCTVAKWIVDEVRKAVEMGYSLLELFEFWKFVKCFDKGNNSGGLFVEYIFLKLKQDSPISKNEGQRMIAKLKLKVFG